MPPSVKQQRIVNSVLCITGLLATAARLAIRYRRQKLWWDDLWIIIAATCSFVFMVVNFLHYEDPDSLSQKTKIAIYWLSIQFYYASTWAARLSLLCTVIRIASSPTMRYFLRVSACLFVISWIVLAAQVFWVCIPEPSWKTLPTPQCALGLHVAIAQSITFIGTDAILVYAPVQLIYNAKLSPCAKFRLIAVFAATLVTTAASLYYIYAMLRIKGVTENYAATIHDGLSLMVANLSVISSFIVQMSSHSSSEEHDPTIWPSSRRTPARSFGFLSTLGPDKAPTPSHVHFHVDVERDYQTKCDSLDTDVEPAAPFPGAHDGKDHTEIPFSEVIELRDILKNASPDGGGKREP